MRLRKKYLFIILLLIMVAFATVSTSLFIVGDVKVGFKANDFDVYFSGAIIDGVDKSNIIISQDKKTIEFESAETLSTIGDASVLEYEVTNNSTQYDVEVEVTCNTTNAENSKYLNIVNSLENAIIPARTVESGTITVTLRSATVDEISVGLTCEVVANATERGTVATGTIETREYSVAGYFVDDEDNPIANATLVVYSETPHYITTDDYGYFYVSGLEKGLHEVYYVGNTENIYVKTKAEIAEIALASGEISTSQTGKIVLTNGKSITDMVISTGSNSSYIIALDADGGNVSVNSIEITENELFGELPRPEKTGYRFLGWYDGDKLITANTMVVGTNIEKLVAHYGLNEITVMLDAGSGELNTASVLVYYGETYGNLPEPTRVGYDFAGWYLNDALITNETIVDLEETITLVAHYTNKTYTVSFDSNGGSEEENITVTYDEKYENLPVPTMVGYTFAGWYYNDTLIDGNSTVRVADDHELVASWTARTYTVSFDASGGSEVEDITVTYDQPYENLPEAIKTNNTFTGWYLNDTLITNETIVNITDDITLIAHYEENRINLISSSYNGTYDGGSHTITVTTQTSGVTVLYSRDGSNYTSIKPTYTDVGEYTIYYRATKTNYFTREGSETVVITKKNSTLTLSSEEENLTYPASTTVNVTENESNGTISVESSNTNIAVVSYENGIITISSRTTAGAATITVRSAATNNYNEIEKTITVNVALGTISYNSNGYNDVYDGEAHGIVVRNVNPAGAIVKYGESENNITLDSTPTYTDAGEYTVYFKIEAAGYTTINDSKKVKITKATNNLSLSSNSGSLSYPNTTNITITNPGNGTLSVESSNSEVATATISGNTLTVRSGTTEGTATITVSAAENTNYNGASAVYEVSVSKGDILYTANGYNGVYDTNPHGIDVTVTDPTGTEIKYGEANGTYNLNSSPTYTNAGEYTVYYRISKTGYTTVTGSTTVVIEKSDNNITLSDYYEEITYPNTHQFVITNPSGGALTVTSSNTNIASVSLSGSTVTITPGTSEGSATITVTSAETPNYNAVTSETEITTNKFEVKVTHGTITYTASNVNTTYDGGAHTINVTTTTSGAEIKYSLDGVNYSTNIETVKYINAGTYEIYYKITAAGYYKVEGSKTLTINKATPRLNIDSTSGTITYPNTTSYNITRNESNGLLSLSTSNNAIATATLDGTVVTIHPGTTAGSATITLTSTDTTGNWETVTREYQVNVSAGTIDYTATNYTGTYDGTFHGISVSSTTPNTTISYSEDNTTWSTTNPTYKNVRIVNNSVSAYTVYFKIEAAGYTTVTGSKTVTISKANNTITLSSNSGSITYPESVSITITNVSGGTLSVESTDTNVATASIEGTTLNIQTNTQTGNANIIVKSAATNNYNAITTDQTSNKYVVTVNPGTISYNANNVEVTYDGGAHGLNVTSTTEGATIKYGETEGTYNLDNSPTYTDAGTYTVYYQITAQAYTTVTGSKTVKINRKQVAVTWSDTLKIYNGSNQTPTVEALSGVTGDTINLTVSGGIQAGSYTSTASCANVNNVANKCNNYTLTNTTNTFTIESAQMVYVANDVTVEYDNSNHGISVSVTTPTSGTTIKYGESRGSYTLNNSPTYKDAGEYTIFFKIEAANYTTVESSVVLTITKAATASLGSCNTLTYNGNSQTLASGGSFVNYTNNSGIAARDNTNPYVVTVTADNNHTFNDGTTTKTLSCTISKANMVYTAPNVSKTYDGNPSGITVNVTTPASGASIKYGEASGTYDKQTSPTLTNAGSKTVYYKIEADNYNAVESSATITIARAKSAETGSCNTLTYNGKSQTLISNGVNVNYSANNTTNGDAGNYDVTINANVNYAFSDNTTSKTLTCTIGKANNTASVNGVGSLTYNGSSQELVSVSGVQGNICYSLSSTPSSCGTSQAVQKAIDAGSYTVYYYVSGNTNYKEKSGSVNVAIAQKNVTIGWQDVSSFNYTGSAQAPTITSASTNIANETINVSRTTFIDAGSHTTEATCTSVTGGQGKCSNYTLSNYTKTFTINKIANTYNASANTLTYTGDAQALITVSNNGQGNVCYSTSAEVTSCATANAVPTATNAGDYTVYYYAAGDTNHNPKSGSINVTISKIANPISVTTNTLTYNGSAQNLVSVSGAQGNVCYSTSAALSSCATANSIPTGTNQGAYTVYYYVAGNTNYKEKSGSVSVTIQRKSVAVSWGTTTTFTYNGSGQAPTASVATGISTETMQVSRTTNKNVGSYTSTASCSSVNNDVSKCDNYTLTNTTQDYSITNATIAYSASDVEVNYDGSAHGISVNVTAPASGATVSYGEASGTYNKTSSPTYTNVNRANGTAAVGSYTVYFKIEATNYATVYGSKTVKIKPINNTLSLSSTSGSFTYPSSKEITITNTSGGTLSVSSNNANIASGSITGNKLTVSAGQTEGTTTITVTSDATVNYNSATATYSATVAHGNIAYTANGYTAAYDGAAHGISVTSTTPGATIKYGEVSGTYNLNASPTCTNVCTKTVYYQITAAGYTTVTGSQTITVSQKQLTVSWKQNASTTGSSPYTYTYNGSAQAPLPSASTGITGETITLARTTQVNASDSNYTSTASCSSVSGGQASCDNYSLTSNTATFKINRATIAYTASNYNGTYNGGSHGIAVSVTTPSSGATISYGAASGTYNKTSATDSTLVLTSVGTKTVYFKIEAANYTTVESSATITITKKDVAVSWGTTTSFTYNGNPQAPTASVSTGITGETMTVTRTTGTNADSYTSTASCSSVSGGQASCDNYNLTSKTKDFTIGRQGISLPSCTDQTYSGSSITLFAAHTSGTYTNSALTGTNAGEYTVSVTPTSNYKWSSDNSTGAKNVTCKINPKSLTVSWKLNSSTTGSSPYAYSYTGSAQAPLPSASTGVTGETINLTRTTQTNASSSAYTSTASCSSVTGGQASCDNYSLTSNTTSFTISKIANTVSVTAVSNLTYTGQGQNLVTKSNGEGNVCYSTSAAVTSCASANSIPQGINAGEYTVYYYAAGDTNHNPASGSVSVSIAKKSIAVSWKLNSSTTGSSPYAYSYNGGSQAPLPSASTGVTGETITLTRTTQINASSSAYTSTASCSSVSGGQASCDNYSLTSNTASFTISKIANTVSVTAVSNLGYTGQGQNLVTKSNGEGNVCYSTSAAVTSCASANSIPQGINAGSYTVYYYAAGDTNHNPASGSVSVSIAKKSIAVSWKLNSSTTGSSPYAYTYNGNSQAPLPSASTGVTGETITLTRTTQINASDSAYTSTASCSSVSGGQASCNNYSLTSNTASFTIGRQAIDLPSCPDQTYSGSPLTLFASHTSGTYTNSALSGTNADSYTVALTPTSNYKWSSDNSTGAKNVTCKIKPKSVSVTWGSTTSFTYNGSPQAPTASVTTGVSGDTMVVTRTTGTNANSYTSTASCTSVNNDANKCNNYTLTNTTKSFTISAATLTVPSSPSAKTYSGGSQNSGVSCPSGSTAGGTQSATDAGTYYHTCTLNSTTNYKWDNNTTTAKSISWVINPKSIAVSWGTTTTFTYNGSEQAPTASASTGISGETMTVSRTTGTDANSYTSTASCSSVSGGRASCSNYTLTDNTKNFTINKANNTLTLSASSGSVTYPNTKTFTISTNTSGGTLSVSSNNTSIATASISGTTVTITSGTTSGTATITVTSAETTNYKSQTATYSITVNPGTINYSASNYSGTYDGYSHGISVSVTSPSGTTIEYSDNNSTWYSSNRTKREPGTYTVYFRIKKAGYTTVTGSKTVTINKKNNTVTLSNNSVTITRYGVNGSVGISSTSGGTYSVSSSNTSVATATLDFTADPTGNGGFYDVSITDTGIGSATITVTSAETTYYKAGNTTISVTVVNPTIEIKNITSTGFDVYAYNIRWDRVNKVQFPTWTDNNGQDDLVWHTASNTTGNTWYYHVNTSSHNNESGTYTTHFYLFDKSDTPYCFGAIGGINVPESVKTFAELIKQNNTINSSYKTYAAASMTATTAGLYESNQTSSGGSTYYFRGAVTNNYVTFAGATWRIIRINEDGTVRIMKQDSIGAKKYSTTSSSSYCTYSKNYNNCGTGCARGFVENWYSNNMTSYDNYIQEGAYFCQGKQTTFSCSNPLTYKVALINKAEALYAGGSTSANNTNYWLYTGTKVGTMTAYSWYDNEEGKTVYDWIMISANGKVTGLSSKSAADMHPVVNLKANVTATGSGTSSDKYVITGLK